MGKNKFFGDRDLITSRRRALKIACWYMYGEV